MIEMKENLQHKIILLTKGNVFHQIIFLRYHLIAFCNKILFYHLIAFYHAVGVRKCFLCPPFPFFMGNASFDAMFSVFPYIFEFIPRVKLFSVIMVKMLSKMMMAMLIVSKENVRSWSCMVISGQFHEYCIILTC